MEIEITCQNRYFHQKARAKPYLLRHLAGAAPANNRAGLLLSAGRRVASVILRWEETKKITWKKSQKKQTAKHAHQWDHWLCYSCTFRKYLLCRFVRIVRKRPRHSHSLHHHSSFHRKDVYLCTAQVDVVWMFQVPIMRHSAWHFRAYSSLCLFLLCSKRKEFLEDDKRILQE